MIFTPTRLAGVFVIEIEPRHDERGFFARTWCARELAEQNLETRVAQTSLSVNARRGTLRGMHYQIVPHEEVKIVQCTRGEIWDVVVDMRSDSPTYLWHVAVELTAANHLQLYIPRGCAHGFQTLTDDAEVRYQMSEFYAADAQRGFRWNDPAVGIDWPLPDPIMNDRDRTYPDLVTARPAAR